MQNGIVMFYNKDKGLGVIVQKDGGNIVVCESGIDGPFLEEGDIVHFDVAQDDGTTCAANVKKYGSIFSA